MATMDVDVPTRICRGCHRSAPVWSDRRRVAPLDDDTRALLQLEDDGGRSPDQCVCGNWFE